MPRQENRPITDLGTLKALAHPLRSQLYRNLGVARTATASQLAEQVDEAVSLVSYHLRKLAEHGLVEEAEPQSADGRERWWQPSSDGVSIRDENFRDAPERAAAHLAATRLFHEQRAAMYRRYLDERPTWGPEWNSAAPDNESQLRLTPADLKELGDELLALAKKYDERGRAAEAAGDTEGRENVALHVYGFPFRV
ncbi:MULTISPECIES: helix-turn-helix domain-containing protein [Streptomyces]|uniref:ArsR/SmtB family transcription factor n=1 Tax=Streptomyces TaxID=1883 RepID=UPI001291DD42|nr:MULTISPECIES: helix-turn-helix domain-containing protein [Streptomyces]KAF2780713.1 ArsR-family transcriptional regulator [Streptomyces sp. OM5714]MCX5038421.1 helix-turn-helix domain-containing protein [Streptomyces coelicoflavus]MDI6520285.1 helix-turn-helix domain-containing protein [Streptomyces coelicoflavus]NHI10225.1 ArsR-family transcriptional regulator [Streptomyces sp. KO7888]QFX84473.1 helix-turn-helix domain-containing protein [Streptomyces sp. SYP-A7193]